jgi:hypothetical protein
MRPILAIVFVAAPVVLAGIALLAQDKPASGKGRIFELRIYTASPGRMDALLDRFRDHTLRFFTKHGMEVIGFWRASSGENAENTLVYMLAYPSMDARKASWDALQGDPDWQQVKQQSEADGTPLAARIESRFLIPTEYSPMR